MPVRCGAERYRIATHVSERVNSQCTDGMHQDANPKGFKVQCGNDQIPDKIASDQALDHGTGTSVSPNALFPVEFPSLLVVEVDVQREDVNEA